MDLNTPEDQNTPDDKKTSEENISPSLGAEGQGDGGRGSTQSLNG